MARVAVPREAAPSKKVTDPVAPEGVTVAERVTVCPKVEEAGETESIVAVGVTGPEPPTTCVTKFEAAEL